MTYQKTWLVLAALGIVALFYAGHGLHQPHAAQLPTWQGVAKANVAPAQKKEKTLTWEVLSSQNAPSRTTVYRAKVPGGWLVMIRNYQPSVRGTGLGNGVTFVPDPQHKWDGASLP